MVRCGKPVPGWLECNRTKGHEGPCDPSVIFWYDHLKQVGAAYALKKRNGKMSVPLWDKVQQVGKAVAGGVAGAVVSVLFTTVTEPDAVINPDAPAGANQLVQLPNTQAEWVTFLVAVVVGFALPYLKRNFPSIMQAQKQLELANNRVAEGKQAA